MTTDDFTDAAMEHLAKVDHDKSREWFDGFVACTRWARDHLAAQEPTDAEVRAVWYALGPRVTIAMEYEDLRDALSAARAVRRDEEKR